MPPARRHCRRIGAHYSRTQVAHESAYRRHMHTRYTTYRRLLHARTSTKRLRPATSGPPRHAPPTTPRRPLRQQRAKRTLPALRPAALAPRQLQREEEGVAVSLRYRHRCPPQRRSLACHHPWGRRRRPVCKGTRILARHCQLGDRNQAFERGRDRQGWVQGGDTRRRPRPQNGRGLLDSPHRPGRRGSRKSRCLELKMKSTLPTPRRQESRPRPERWDMQGK